MGGTITVVRIGGIPIRIHFSWLFILAIMIWSLGAVEFPDSYPHWTVRSYWIAATVTALLLFVSVLLHELSHALLSLARGIKVEAITLFLFGGVTQISEEARSPGTELAVAVVGPITSIVLGVALVGAAAAAGGNAQVRAVLEYLAGINLLLGGFNLLPGFPLDGGRVLRASVWARTKDFARATMVATSVSRAIAMLMIVGGILLAFGGAGFTGVWIAFIGWYIESQAGNTQAQVQVHNFLEGVQVSNVMNTDVVTVVPALPVSQLVEQYIVGSHHRSFPVFGGGKLWGIVTLADVAHLPRDRWPETAVEAIMTPRERLKTAASGAPLEQVIGDLQHAGVKQLVVLDDETEKVAGLISRGDLMDFLQVRQLVYKGA